MRRLLLVGASAAVVATLVLMLRPTPQKLETRPPPHEIVVALPPAPSIRPATEQPIQPIQPIQPTQQPQQAAPEERPGFLGGIIVRGSCAGQTNVCASSEATRRCQVTDEGRFLLEVPPGRYHLLAVCDQMVAEHVGELDVASGERLEGLMITLQPSGAIGLAVELPPGVEDEDFLVTTDPPMHDSARNSVHFEPGGALERPIQVSAGKVHVRARGRCLTGDADVDVQPRTVTRFTMQLEERPCE